MSIAKIALCVCAAGFVAASGAQAAIHADDTAAGFEAKIAGALSTANSDARGQGLRVALNPQPLPPFVDPDHDDEDIR